MELEPFTRVLGVFLTITVLNQAHSYGFLSQCQIRTMSRHSMVQRAVWIGLHPRACLLFPFSPPTDLPRQYIPVPMHFPCPNTISWVLSKDNDVASRWFLFMTSENSCLSNLKNVVCGKHIHSALHEDDTMPIGSNGWTKTKPKLL